MNYLETQPIWRLPGWSFSIQGFSRAKRCTGFWIPEWNILLDAGLPSRSIIPEVILLTHTHTDHSGQLAHLCMNTTMPFPILCPPKAQLPLQHFFAAVTKLRGCSERVQYCENLFSGSIAPLAPEHPIIDHGGFDFYAVKLHHSVPSQGYVICKNDIAHLAYFCDGTSKSIGDAVTMSLFMHNWTDKPVFMLECTYLTEKDKALANRHACFEDYKPLFTMYPHVQFMLFHFCETYSERDFVEYGNLFPNVGFLI